MILTILIAFGALFIADIGAVLLAPGEIAAERSFLASQCIGRLTPIARRSAGPRKS